MNKYLDNFYDWWKNIDKFILFTILTLFLLGLFFSLVSTSLIASDKLDTKSYYFFFKHFKFVVSSFPWNRGEGIEKMARFNVFTKISAC